MGMLDKALLLSDQQSLVQAAGTYLSANVMDIGLPGTIPQGGSPIHDLGRGEPADLWIQLTVACTSGGSATLQVQLVLADDTAISSNVTVLAETAVLALATLVQGYQFRLQPFLPPGVMPTSAGGQRYLALRYIIGTAAMTGGAITAGICFDKQTNVNVI